MANNSDFAGPGGAVAEDDKNMSYQNKEQITRLEQELENAERDFRKSAEAQNMQLVLQAHNRMCQLVASLSAAWSETGKPTVFSRFYVAPQTPVTPNLAATKTPQPVPSTPPAASAVPAPAPAATPAPAPAATPAPAPKGDEPSGGLDIAALEKQLAELASKMQKCLEAGDMDGMLAANEKMGELSELMAKAEAKQKAAKQQDATANPPATAKGGASSSGWAAGDTMALAKQRAEERKKQQRLADSSFDVVVGDAAAAGQTPAATPPADASQSSSGAAAFLSDKMKAKMKESGEVKAPQKKMTQEQLREKLEQYNFYEILSVASTASFEELHRSFLRKIKKLNAKLYSKELEDWQFQEFVASLCLAHDVLKFPNARLQYDLVLFGPGDGMSPETAAKQKMMPLKEMIKFSTLVSARDLAQAVQETQGGDEREIGHYLVAKELLSAEEFDSILFAQKLVSKGKLTVAQFELAMQEMRENSIPLLDTLVASEWIQPHEVFSGDFS